MGLVPISQYPDDFTVATFGPFDAADFGSVDGLVSMSTSISTSLSQNQSSGGFTANLTSSQSSGVSLAVFNSLLFPARDVYIDHVQMRAKVISTDNINKLRLLSVSNGQSVLMAFRNKQFVTLPAEPTYQASADMYGGNLGDESSSFSLDDSGSYQPLVANQTQILRVNPGRHANGAPANRVPAGGLLVILAEEVPDALVDLVLTVGYRTRAQ